MELPVKIQSVIKVDGDGFICCSGKDFLTQFKPHQQKQAFKIFQTILDGLGALSAKAQALKQIITSSIKFTGTDHRIYIKVKDNKALGFVKVGQKNLFYRDFIGNIKEMKPTCVLDIYVHQSCQRSGIGKEVFQKFLKHQHKFPEKLAYDRPSQKLLSFLKKHYGLVKFIPQNNNFVIYDRYFSKQLPTIVQEPVQTKLPTLAPQIPNITTTSQTKLRPRTNLSTNIQKVQKVEEITEKSYQKIEQKPEPRRQFQQFQKFHIQKHKNNNSQGFPLSIAINDNPTFRTSSGAYGNYYRRKP